MLTSAFFSRCHYYKKYINKQTKVQTICEPSFINLSFVVLILGYQSYQPAPPGYRWSKTSRPGRVKVHQGKNSDIFNERYFARHLYITRMSFVFKCLSFLCHLNIICVSLLCQSYVLACHSLCSPISFASHSYVILIPFVCNHSYTIHFIPLMLFVCHSYLFCVSLVCIGMSLICHQYLLVCYSYVTCRYSYATCIPLLCTRISFVCHSYEYVTLMYSYVIRTCFYHEPLIRFITDFF